MANDPKVAKEAEQYLAKKQATFQTYKRDWEKFPDEVMSKAKEILLNGITPEVTKSRSANGYSYNVNIDLNQNQAEVERYLSTLKTQLHGKADKFHAEIEEMIEKLEHFQKNGLDQSQLRKLTVHFTQWVEQTKVLTFRSGESHYEIKLPEQILAKCQKWLNTAPAPEKKAPAAKPTAQKQEPAVDQVAVTLKKRKAEAQRIQDMVKKDYETELGLVQKRYDRDLKQISDGKSKVTKELAKKKLHLEKLGFFKFKEKRAAKDEIAALEQKISELQQQTQDLQDSYEEKKIQARKKAEKNWESQRKWIRERVPAPDGLSLPDSILLSMDPGTRYTPQDIAAFPYIPIELTAHWLNSRILSSLASQGKLRRITENGNIYYMLP